VRVNNGCALAKEGRRFIFKGPIPRLRISISIRIAYADKKWNKLNNVGAILVVRIRIRINFVRIQVRIESLEVSDFIRMRMTYARH